MNLTNITFEDVLEGKAAPVVEKKLEDVSLPEKKDEVVEKTEAEKAKEAEEALKVKASEDSEGSVYEALTKLIGYEIEGEFEESVEGIAEYTRAVSTKMAEEEVKELFESYPDVKEYLQFRLNNGDPAKYFEAKYGDVDYSKYQVTENDETGQEVVVRKYLASQNYTDAEANEIVKDYKDTNLLFKMAKKAADKMTETQQNRKASVIQDQAKKAQEAEAKREEVVAEISDVIEKGALHNIVIPEKDKREFKAWLLNANAKGQTKRQETMNKLTIAQKLELEYLAFKGFDLKDLVRKEATQTKINFLQKNANPKGSRLGGTGKENKVSSGNKALSDVKISDLI